MAKLGKMNSALRIRGSNLRFNSAIPGCSEGRGKPHSELLMKIFNKLYETYGPRHWWPGETPFEVMVGAILTQNTSWRNVEKAIDRLKARRLLNVKGIHRLKRKELASLIKSSGYYRIKADRLKAFVNFIVEGYGGSIEKMRRGELEVLRQELLHVNGVGPETADSILLYGLKKPIFVIDAYTKRILARHRIVLEKAPYDELQKLFMDHLPRDEKLFNEYHALLVHLGKTLCKKIPKCALCPLKAVEHTLAEKSSSPVVK
jgi:endonuclease-3 related protein